MTIETAPPRRGWYVLVGIGLAAGFLSGFFGVGGGTLIVPALVLLLRYEQRLATGTSLAAIIPSAIVGVIGYVLHGSVAWFAGLILAIGAVAGAWLGAWLLHRLPVVVLRWIFTGFLIVVIVELFITVPDRGASLEITPLTGAFLLLLGLITGILSGLVGVGGGVILVPALTVFFGISDLIAKGTSLLVIIPTTITGTIGNSRRRNVDLRAALIIGLSAAPLTYVGVLAAVAVPAQVASILFGLYLSFVVIQLITRTVRRPRTPPPAAPAAEESPLDEH